MNKKLDIRDPSKISMIPVTLCLLSFCALFDSFMIHLLVCHMPGSVLSMRI